MKLICLSLVVTSVSCAHGPGPVTPTNPVERQMIGLLQKFDRWDDDGNGELSEKELNMGIARYKGTPTQVNYTGKQIVEFYDADHNGAVSLREAQDGYGRADQLAKKYP